MVGLLLSFFVLCHLNTIVDEHPKAQSVSLWQSTACHSQMPNRISSSKPFFSSSQLCYGLFCTSNQVINMMDFVHVFHVNPACEWTLLSSCLLTEVHRSQGDVPALQLSFVRNLLYFSSVVPFTCLAQKLSHRYPLLHSVSNQVPEKMQMLTFTHRLFCQLGSSTSMCKCIGIGENCTVDFFFF